MEQDNEFYKKIIEETDKILKEMGVSDIDIALAKLKQEKQEEQNG